MRILVYGTGVIGSVYAAKLWYASNDVYVCSRGERLEAIRENGIVIKDLGTGKRIVTFPDIFEPSSEIDFDVVLVTVRFDQLDAALPEIALIPARAYVFMLNNPSGFGAILRYIPQDKFVPAFPGVGGEFVNQEVHYHILNPRVQPTTIARQSPDCYTEGSIPSLFRHAGFPTVCSPDMDAWLKVHAAIICPVANAVYLSNGSANRAAKSFRVRYKMAKSMSEGVTALVRLSINFPFKYRFIGYLPSVLVAVLSRFVLATDWANNVIANHANKAGSEMKAVNTAFINLIESKGEVLTHFKQMAIEAKMYNL